MQNEIQTEIQTEPQPETKTTQCLNCGTEFVGNYCPECGQNAETGRFTMRFIIENLLAAFLSKDGGIWFTLKNLFSRPGAMIVEILNGKRRKYFSPFPMLFCSLTLYVLIFSISGSHDDYREFENQLHEKETEIVGTVDFNISAEDAENVQDDEVKVEVKKSLYNILVLAVSFYNNHYTAVFMLTLPILLLATRAWYGKSNRRRYYKAEYLVAIVYAMVMVVLFRCLVSLVYLFSERASDVINNFFMVVIVAAFTACFQKMLGFSIAKTAWRSLLAIVLYYIILGALLLSVLLILIFFVFFVVKRQQG